MASAVGGMIKGRKESQYLLGGRVEAINLRSLFLLKRPGSGVTELARLWKVCSDFFPDLPSFGPVPQHAFL